ncbi:MAG TPA: DUF1326 domain-containing protein [Rhizomicrobium sp.]|nr:DUF1326 domain-containing protein [Rhizomicrobium sp.]
MTSAIWEFEGREFTNCNCAYGCPCQFNALPTYGHCQAAVGIQIDKGRHRSTVLDGLKVAGVFRWPGPIHEGNGEAAVVVDQRATPAQREALLRILTGQDTDPGATIFQVFSTTLTKLHEPVFADIEFEVDVDRRRARLHVEGMIETRGEPIVNPVTGAEYRGRIDLPNGFEYTLAEVGRGWSQVTGPIPLTLADSYGQFAKLHLSEHGIVR